MLPSMSVQPLVIQNIEAGYQRTNSVLKDISLSLEGGDAFALVGANGAGKTTLIKSVLDFISINNGKITIFGHPHVDYHSRSEVAFLPEHFQPPYYLKGRDYLRSMSRLYSVAYDEDSISVTMEKLDLPLEALDRSVKEYSKGMAQKLGLLACLHSGRNLLIMDEPMSGLDPKSRHAFKGLLRDLNQQGRTLFYSTHVLADISAICNKMAILDSGRIRFTGSPIDCCQQFASDDLESAYMACINTDSVNRLNST